MRSLSIIFVVCSLIALPVLAQEYEQKFNARCTQSGKTASFCSCALEALSNDMRKQNTRKLAENKMHLKNSTEALLADPVMTQGKIDAVCDLHDEAHAHDVKASLTGRQQGPEQARQWTDKKLAAMKQKEELAMSYGASRETNAALVAGDYCKLRHEVNQMSQDLSESEDVIYAKVRRMIDAEVGFAPYFRSAYKAGCK